MSNQTLKDRIPPHNDEAERAALGAMLIDSDAVVKSILKLQSEDFYSPANGKIFRAIKNIHDAGLSKPDIISVHSELSKMGELDSAGGEAYISSLTTVVPTAANIDYYIGVIEDNAMRRALISIAAKISAKAFDLSEKSLEILEKAQQLIFELIEERHQYRYRPVRELITVTLPAMEELFDNEYTGVRSGFTEIDKLTRGFQKSEMIVIGARPSIGKTALALNMAANIAFMQRVPVAFFSLEMRDTLLTMRLLSSEAMIDLKTVRKQSNEERSKSFSKIQDAAVRIYEAPLFIEDMPNMQLMDLRTQARHIREKEKVEIIFIDYLGLIGVENNYAPRFEQVSEISRSIKGLARELNIPIVVLSQVGRGSEGAAPTLANLRDSGAVEQDADVVMLLHRDRKLDPDNPDKDYFDTDVEIAKNRNGPTGLVKLAYKPKFTRFYAQSNYDE